MAKILRHYVREEKRLTLAEAVHKMTAQTAEQLGIAGRGPARARPTRPIWCCSIPPPSPITLSSAIPAAPCGPLAFRMSWSMARWSMPKANATGTWPGQFREAGYAMMQRRAFLAAGAAGAGLLAACAGGRRPVLSASNWGLARAQAQRRNGSIEIDSAARSRRNIDILRGMIGFVPFLAQ